MIRWFGAVFDAAQGEQEHYPLNGADDHERIPKHERLSCLNSN